MKAYALLDMDIHDPEGYSKYPPQVWPLIEKHGGRIFVFDSIPRESIIEMAE